MNKQSAVRNVKDNDNEHNKDSRPKDNGKELCNPTSGNRSQFTCFLRHDPYSLYLHCEALICFTTLPVVVRSHYLGWLPCLSRSHSSMHVSGVLRNVLFV